MKERQAGILPRVVVRSAAYCLAHVPELVPYGSKPRREIARDPALRERLRAALRSEAEAVCYAPNQTFIGNLSPRELEETAKPWFRGQADSERASRLRQGPFGEICGQETFLAILKAADVLKPPLFAVPPAALERLRARLAAHPLLADWAELLADTGVDGAEPAADPEALAITCGAEPLGYFSGDRRAEGRDDPNLQAPDLLENLCSKASGALALRWLLHRAELTPGEVDFVISCGEEACGDRYQRGGGGMAKAVAALAGCVNASGMDVKNFCAAPASSLVTAAAQVASGIYRRVAVVGGGSAAKLGMKFEAFLGHGMPILDDCLASMAFLVTADDGVSPVIRLGPGAVGAVPVGASTSEEAVFRHYLLAPLAHLGLRCTDIDRYAAELQNPEIMEFAGSGDVARKNYRKIAATAVRAGHLDQAAMEAWIARVGMPGFAPTQGHIPSAAPYLGHAIEAMARGEIRRAMFLSRASLFLNRCTDLLDGVSFVLEANPGKAAG